jgi:predicted acetyltransferase
MTDLPIRPGTPADWPSVSQLMQLVFHEGIDPEADTLEQAVFEPERSLVAEDAGTIVAHAGAYTRTLSVPGGTLPAAHVTLVGVAPTHRRQRLLTRLMRRQLDEVPEPVAVLWASEGRIYPRFGYGMATRRLGLSVDTREVRLPAPKEPGRLRPVPRAGAGPALREVYEAVREDRPGWSDRAGGWWAKILADPPGARRGAAEKRVVLHEGATGVDGYAVWRVRHDWSTGGPECEVHVREVVATGPDAYLALWRFLLGIDLTRSAKLWFGSPEEPLLHLADEPRRVGATLGDGLFVRIVDLPAALAARRYAAPVDAVLEVADALRPGNAGRWRLTADGGKAACTRTDEPAELACDIADLGAAYLGGTGLAALADAGRVRELRDGALATASTAFGWHRCPAGLEVF